MNEHDTGRGLSAAGFPYVEKDDVAERLAERVEQARAASPVVFGRECYFPLADVMGLLAKYQTVSGALAFLKGHVANYEAAQAPLIAPNGTDLTPGAPLGEPVRMLVDAWFTPNGGVRMWKQVRAGAEGG